jgi:hypothetical protein
MKSSFRPLACGFQLLQVGRGGRFCEDTSAESQTAGSSNIEISREANMDARRRAAEK